MELYPNALFIHMVRDPRDTILSYKEVNFDANNTATLSYRWNIYNRAILKYKERIGERYHLVRFEDLLTKPEDTLTGICEFLNVGYNPEMLEFYKKDQDWVADFRKNLKNPLDPSRAYRWKKVMNRKQQIISGCIAGALALKFQYENFDKQKSFIRFSTIPHQFYAGWVTFLERFVYMLPLWLVAPIIAFYRKITAPKTE